MENNYFKWGIGMSIIVPCVGYLSYLYIKKKVTNYFFNKIVDKIHKDTKKDDNEQYFRPITKNSAIISFNRLGKKESVYIPYNRRMSSTMLTKNIYLIKNGEKTLLNQNPGVPFMVSAEDLGGDEIIVEDKEGNILIKFNKDQIPIF